MKRRVGRWKLWLSVALLSVFAATGGAAAETAAAPQAIDPVAETVLHLGLDTRQEAAYRAYLAAVAALRPNKPGLAEEQLRTMSLPERLDFIAGRIADQAEAERANAAELRRLYEVLTPTQRQSFDRSGLSPPGKPGLEADASEPPPASIPNPSLPARTNPDWLVKPNSNDLERVYPYTAWKLEVTGAAVMQCDVNEDGFLSDCIITSETPTGMGFGNAALEVSAYMRMKPATNYGVPIRSSVVVPVRFEREKVTKPSPP